MTVIDLASAEKKSIEKHRKMKALRRREIIEINNLHGAASSANLISWQHVYHNVFMAHAYARRTTAALLRCDRPAL